MIGNEAQVHTTASKVGWGILLALSALMVLHGVFWFFDGPETALENIAERTSLAPSGFELGSPSAYDVITLVNRNYAILEAGLGSLAILTALRGIRGGSPWVWWAMGVFVAALAGLTLNFVAAGGLGGASVSFLIVAVVALLGLLLTRPG